MKILLCLFLLYSEALMLPPDGQDWKPSQHHQQLTDSAINLSESVSKSNGFLMDKSLLPLTPATPVDKTAAHVPKTRKARAVNKPPRITIHREIYNTSETTTLNNGTVIDRKFIIHSADNQDIVDYGNGTLTNNGAISPGKKKIIKFASLLPSANITNWLFQPNATVTVNISSISGSNGSSTLLAPSMIWSMTAALNGSNVTAITAVPRVTNGTFAAVPSVLEFTTTSTRATTTSIPIGRPSATTSATTKPTTRKIAPAPAPAPARIPLLPFPG